MSPSRCTTSRPNMQPQRGIIIADTKFEFGLTPEGELILMDEALTPDSSRFWPASQLRGRHQPALLRQAVRARLPRNPGLEQEGSRTATAVPTSSSRLSRTTTKRCAGSPDLRSRSRARPATGPNTMWQKSWNLLERALFGPPTLQPNLLGRLLRAAAISLRHHPRPASVVNWTLRATGLVYTTLLALIPLIALSFAVLKAFGAHTRDGPLPAGVLPSSGRSRPADGGQADGSWPRRSAAVWSAWWASHCCCGR